MPLLPSKTNRWTDEGVVAEGVAKPGDESKEKSAQSLYKVRNGLSTPS